MQTITTTVEPSTLTGFEQEVLSDPYFSVCPEDLLHVPPDLDPSNPFVSRGSKPRRTSKGTTGGIFRYPGGKQKLLPYILPRLDEMAASLGSEAEYREPFLGAGAVAIGLLRKGRSKKAWLNDQDPAMAALWNSIINGVSGLTTLIEVFPEVIRLFPEDDYFRYYKRLLLSIRTSSDLSRFSPEVVPLLKVAVHLMSFSGLGTRAGGAMGDPLGRYNSNRINSNLLDVNRLLSGIEVREQTCTSYDFETLFGPGEALFYLDPPYYEAGPALYQFSFGHEDHVRLAESLRSEGRPWLLSYDSHPVILDLYSGWARIEEVAISYSINGCGKKTELLISNR